MMKIFMFVNIGEIKIKLSFAIEEADIFVTYTDYTITDNVVKTQILKTFIFITLN